MGEQVSGSRAGDEACREELADLEERYSRALADLASLRRREQQETRRAVRQVSEALLAEWLDVVDNLERALAHEPPTDGDGISAGVVATLDQARELLASHSVRRMDVLQKPFDPEWHEAVGVSDEGEPGIVMRELIPGYVIEDRVLRAARVIVGRSTD